MTPDPLPPASPVAVVVNDDPTQLNLLAGLVRKAGLDPRAFTGAEAALAAMDRAHPPALIVTDLYMEGITSPSAECDKISTDRRQPPLNGGFRLDVLSTPLRVEILPGIPPLRRRGSPQTGAL